MPDTSSVTGCSTCKRVFTSRKEMVQTHQEFAGSAPTHPASFTMALLARYKLRDLLLAEERRRCLFDQFLVAALKAAITSGDDHHVAVHVGQHLGPRRDGVVQIALDEALATAERGHRLPHGGVVQFGDLFQGACNLQAPATSSECSLMAIGRPFSLANSTTSSAPETGSEVPPPGVHQRAARCAEQIPCRPTSGSPKVAGRSRSDRHR